MLKPVVAACVTACVVALSILVAFAFGTVARSPRYTLQTLRVSSSRGSVDCLYRLDTVEGAVESLTAISEDAGPSVDFMSCPAVKAAGPTAGAASTPPMKK